MEKSPPSFARLFNRLRSDRSGAVLIEAAFAIPLIAVLLSGVISYAMYMMAAHGLQSVANEGARAAIAGLNAAEREQLVGEAISRSLLQATFVDPEDVEVQTDIEDSFYTVSLDYDTRSNPFFTTSLVPLPHPRIKRSATVDLPAI